MTISPTIPSAATDLASTWADDVADLTDRRRLLLRAVFGVDVAPSLVDQVFVAPPRARQGDAASSPSGSTTSRSGGRSSSTVAR